MRRFLLALCFVFVGARTQPALAGDILYVNQNEDPNAAILWENAFTDLGIAGNVDRLDLLGTTLFGVFGYVNPLLAYRIVLWDGGSAQTPSGYLTAADSDWRFINRFMYEHAFNGGGGGVYFCGDDMLDSLYTSSYSDAVEFASTWLPFIVVTSDHAPLFGVSPTVEGLAGSEFAGRSFVVNGTGVPQSDFDVAYPIGPTHMAASYGAPGPTNGAIMTNKSHQYGYDVVAVMAGFSFAHVDDFVNYAARTESATLSGASTRALFLGDILHTLGYEFPATGVGGSPVINQLAQNHPNPFNPQTVIEYTLVARSHATLRIYSVAGTLVRTLIDGQREAGRNEVTWNGLDDTGHAVSSGIYFARLTAQGFAETRKMVLLK